MTNRIDSDTQFLGQAVFNKAPIVPAGSFSDAAISQGGANSKVQAEKLEHAPSCGMSFLDEPSTGQIPIYFFNGAGTIQAVEAFCTDLPTTGNVTFDVLLTTAASGSTGATILSGAIPFEATTSVVNKLYNGTVSVTTASAGAVLILKINTTGTATQLGSGYRVQCNVFDDGTAG